MAELGDLIQVSLPVELERETPTSLLLSTLETHYDQIARYERSDIIVVLPASEIMLDIGTAYGLRKQLIGFSARSDELPEALAWYIMLHVTPKAASPSTSFIASDGPGAAAVNPEFEHAFEAACSKLIDALRVLAPIYIDPHPQYEMLATVAAALQAKWERT